MSIIAFQRLPPSLLPALLLPAVLVHSAAAVADSPAVPAAALLLLPPLQPPSKESELLDRHENFDFTEQLKSKYPILYNKLVIK